MKRNGRYFIYLIVTGFGLSSCQNNSQKNAHLRDSLMAVNSSDSSILLYAISLDKQSASLKEMESPVYEKGDYLFYSTMFLKDSLPVIYQEFGDAGKYGFSDKRYYLQNGELVLFTEKDKQASSGEKPDYEFKESRFYFRNNVFLKAEERIANSDSSLTQTSFSLMDENLVDKNKQVNFKRLEDAVHGSGNFNLVFDRLQDLSSKKYLVLGSNDYESSYLVKKPDSLIIKIGENPAAYKGRKLNVKYKRQGIQMIYEGGDLAF